MFEIKERSTTYLLNLFNVNGFWVSSKTNQLIVFIGDKECYFSYENLYEANLQKNRLENAIKIAYCKNINSVFKASSSCNSILIIPKIDVVEQNTFDILIKSDKKFTRLTYKSNEKTILEYNKLKKTINKFYNNKANT